MDPDTSAVPLLPISLVERLFDQIQNAPFFIKDRALRYVGANHAMVLLCGATSREELIGKTAHDFFPREFALRYEVLDQRVLSSAKPIKDRLDLSIRAKTSPLWLLFTRWPIHGPNGHIVGVAASSRSLDTPLGHHPRFAALAKVVSEMQSNYPEPLRVGHLAEKAGVSQSQLHRDFVSIFKMSPHHYLAKIRLVAAMEMLHSNTSIAAIAQACGYSDQAAFSRRFRAAVGVSPGEFRRSARDASMPLE
ncbi:MAG: AraC family transcriptional regulator [Hyphomonadaceae bacterium]|nr:AraC family transcriptional regulator [Hyphomonadaceae bacterium]